MAENMKNVLSAQGFIAKVFNVIYKRFKTEKLIYIIGKDLRTVCFYAKWCGGKNYSATFRVSLNPTEYVPSAKGLVFMASAYFSPSVRLSGT